MYLSPCADGREFDSDLDTDDDEDGDDEIDYFADVPSDDEGLADSKRAHYDDFFDAPGDELKSLKKKEVRHKDEVERAEREEGEEERDSDSFNDEGEGSDDGEFSEEEEESIGDLVEEKREDQAGESIHQLKKKGEEEEKQTLSSHEKKQLKVSNGTCNPLQL